MFSSSLYEDIKGIEEDIQAVKDKVEDPLMCDKIKLFVYAPRDIQRVYKADAGSFPCKKWHVQMVNYSFVIKRRKR